MQHFAGVIIQRSALPRLPLPGAVSLVSLVLPAAALAHAHLDDYLILADEALMPLNADRLLERRLFETGVVDVWETQLLYPKRYGRPRREIRSLACRATATRQFLTHLPWLRLPVGPTDSSNDNLLDSASFKTHTTNQTTFSQRGPRLHYCATLSGAALRTWRTVLQVESVPFANDQLETVLTVLHELFCASLQFSLQSAGVGDAVGCWSRHRDG